MIATRELVLPQYLEEGPAGHQRTLEPWLASQTTLERATTAKTVGLGVDVRVVMLVMV